MQFQNQRAYSRGNHFNGRVKVSRDGDVWEVADVSDVSSGGLKLYTSVQYEKGDILWFDLLLQSFMSEFEVKTMGEIRHRASTSGGFTYGVAFKGLSQEKKIQIDENVRLDRPVSGGGYEAD